MSDSKFKVLIVGGSVAGLTLANMLDQVGIDYLVLEAYREIAPQLGASIGLQANGLRILDQIGCHDALMSLIDKPLSTSWIRDTDGSALSRYTEAHTTLIERNGYQTIFIDRQMLIQTLYNNLGSKEKILTNQKVETVQMFDTYVEVTTVSGETHHGDILVGADGIYSTVRSEMWRLARKTSPTHFPSDEWSNVPCDYQCIFGISRPLTTFSDPGVCLRLGNGYSYLVMTGPKGRLYWFFLNKMSERKYGDDIPKFSKKEEEELAELHTSDPINTETTFGDLYEARTTSVLTPLHEHVFQKWYYKRITTIGDAAHKFHPITGHGGNSAIETAATLTNHLVAKLGKRNTLPASDIEDVFKKTQDDRFDRVIQLVNAAHKRQQNDGLETPLNAVLARTLPRLLSRDVIYHISGASFLGGSRLEMLPIPKRPHAVPFDDELPSKPRSSWFPVLAGLAPQIGMYWLSRRTIKLSSIPQLFIDSSIREHYTGIKIVDAILARLVTVFGCLVSPSNAGPRMHMMYFLPIMASSALDWTIEGHRRGNKGSPISWPSIWSTAYQIFGIGKIAPLYNIASILTSGFTNSLSTGSAIGRTIPPEVSEALLPSLAVGLVIPSILLFTPFDNRDTWQKFVALWQPSPAYVGLFASGVSQVYAKLKPNVTAGSSQEEKLVKSGNSKGSTKLTRVYGVAFGAATLYHFYTMYQIWKSPELSIGRVFGQLGNPFTDARLSTEEGITTFLKWDMLLSTTSFLSQGIYRIWELWNLGYITTSKALKATACASVGHILIGPAASHIGLAGWKENELNKFSQKN